MSQDGVTTAFDLILGEIDNVTQELGVEGAQAFQNRKYDQAASLSRTGIDLAQFQSKVRALQQE